MTRFLSLYSQRTTNIHKRLTSVYDESAMCYVTVTPLVLSSYIDVVLTLFIPIGYVSVKEKRTVQYIRYHDNTVYNHGIAFALAE